MKKYGDGAGRQGASAGYKTFQSQLDFGSSNAYPRSQVDEDFPLRGLDEVQDGQEVWYIDLRQIQQSSEHHGKKEDNPRLRAISL